MFPADLQTFLDLLVKGKSEHDRGLLKTRAYLAVSRWASMSPRERQKVKADLLQYASELNDRARVELGRTVAKSHLKSIVLVGTLLGLVGFIYWRNK